MPKLEVVNVFIASPGDLSEERKLFPAILNQINDIKAGGMNYQFNPLGWEDTLPGWGRPQEHINYEVRRCDIFLMLLWKRWGTPSGEFSSGTEEEFQIAYERYKSSGSPYLLLYFRSVPQSMMADPGEQLQKVIKFRNKIEEEKIGLYKAFDEPSQWKDLLMKHLSQWLDKKMYGKGYAAEAEEKKIQLPIEIEKRMLELQKELHEKNAQLETAQSKLRVEAIGYAVEAAKFVDEGKLTLAEEKFAKSVELYDEPEVLRNFGRFLYQIGSLDRAKELFEKLLGISEGSYQASAYSNLGAVYKLRGDLNKAEEMYIRALEINRTIGNKEGIAKGYASIGNVYFIRGDLNKAKEMLEKALGMDSALGNKEGMAKDYNNLGNVYKLRGDLDKAEEMYNKALEINKTIGNKEGVANAYGNLGNVYTDRKDSSKAEEMHIKALEIDSALGFKKGIAEDYNNLGSVYGVRMELNKAEEMLKKALEIDSALGNKEGMAQDYSDLGNVYKIKGDLNKAEEIWMKAVKLYSDLPNDGKVKQIQSWIDLIKSNTPPKAAKPPKRRSRRRAATQ